ncbi:hypothetical protein DKX38_026766 [Salix brachista]|uniref:Uncharacterized protein n=1 Tax=Salix brachista TaxID=2182728 RepID=A0A5N5JAB4_9ROSI|nr:hypothetical protein DKX38_026766 [Salix brachista]
MLKKRIDLRQGCRKAQPVLLQGRRWLPAERDPFQRGEEFNSRFQNLFQSSILTFMNMQSCFGKSSMTGGAMTYFLIHIVKKNPTITYGKLIDSIHEHIEKANSEGCLPGVIKRVLNTILSQKPQLSASEEFNVNEKQFIVQ